MLSGDFLVAQVGGSGFQSQSNFLQVQGVFSKVLTLILKIYLNLTLILSICMSRPADATVSVESPEPFTDVSDDFVSLIRRPLTIYGI